MYRLIIFIILLFLVLVASVAIEKNDNNIKAQGVRKKPSLEEILSNCYVINLDKCPERYEYAQKELLKYFNNVTRFPAIRGVNKPLVEEVKKELGVVERNKAHDPKEGIDMSKGQIGCALSHLSLYDKLLSSTKDYMFIFEDDIMLANNFKDEFSKFWESTPSDFDVVFVGNQIDTTEFKHKTIKKKVQVNKIQDLRKVKNSGESLEIKFDKNLKKTEISDFISTRDTFCCHGYIMTRSGATKILNYVTQKGFRPIDIDIVNITCKGGICSGDKVLNTYSYVKNIDTEYKDKLPTWKERSTGLVFQRDVESTIHEN